MSQFLEGDIQLSQRYSELDRQRLNLQQDQVDFNKKMLVANTIIQGANALSNVMNAGLNVYSAFDNYSKQKEIKIMSQAKNDLELQITQDVLSGKTRMTTNENGQLTYTGLTPEAEAIRAGYENQIKDDMGGIKWGNAGRASESLNQMFSDLNVGTARMVADKTYKDLQNEFQTNLQSSIQEFIKTGDSNLYEETINQAKGWMSEEVWNQYRTKAEEDMRVGRIENNVMVIGQTQGMDKVSEHLAGQNITEDQRAQLFSRAQNASNQATVAMSTAARDTYTQAMNNNGGNIGDAYRTAIKNASDNPAVEEAVKKTAQAAQFDSLSNRFGQELASVDSMSLDHLQNLKRTYENRRSDYQDQGMLYKQHLDAIQREIDQRQPSEPRSSASSIRTEAENVMANLYVQFNNKETTGPVAITGINQLRELSPLKAAEYEAKILGGGDNPAAQETYLALDGIIRANNPGTKVSAEERIEYERSTQAARQAIFQAYFNGVREEQLTQLVEGYRKDMASQVLQNAFTRGSIGNSGLFGTADNIATAFAFHSNQGNLDLRYSERTTDARRPYDTTPLTVGGENAERVMQQAAEENRSWANNQLSNKGIELTNVNYESDSSGDRDGRISYRGSDGNTYRVNAASENGVRFLERLESNRWVRIDLRSIPDLPRTERTGRIAVGREIGNLANMDHLPMPPEYAGRNDDIMMRHEFINSYGLERYKQFLDDSGINWR